jgi:hypothetical protein
MQFSNLDQSFSRFLKPVPVKASTVTARLENTVSGTCPYCKDLMTKTSCCDQQMYICEKDRAVFPLENSSL